MSITLDLQVDLLERLRRQAQAREMSLQDWVIQVLSHAPEFPDQSAAWGALNARRFQLIQKRHEGGLSPGEEAELTEIQAIADRWLEPLDRQRLQVLKPYEELAQKFTQPSHVRVGKE